jgi:hypothetical protein
MFLLNRNARRSKAGGKRSIGAPVIRRIETPPSPASFSTPDVIEILPTPATESYPGRSLTPPPPLPAKTTFTSSPSRGDSSPRVFLNFDHEPLAASFSAELLGPQAIAARRRGVDAESVGRARPELSPRKESVASGSIGGAASRIERYDAFASSSTTTLSTKASQSRFVSLVPVFRSMSTE